MRWLLDYKDEELNKLRKINLIKTSDYLNNSEDFFKKMGFKIDSPTLETSIIWEHKNQIAGIIIFCKLLPLLKTEFRTRESEFDDFRMLLLFCTLFYRNPVKNKKLPSLPDNIIKSIEEISSNITYPEYKINIHSELDSELYDTFISNSIPKLNYKELDQLIQKMSEMGDICRLIQWKLSKSPYKELEIYPRKIFVRFRYLMNTLQTTQ